jgi:hypothetical protein
VCLYRHYSNIVELNVVDIFVKIVDCRVFIIIELVNTNSTVASSKNHRVIFSPRWSLTHFLALQMVNFSSLHDEGRPADVFRHYRRDTLVHALRSTSTDDLPTTMKYVR